ncbi:2Fe-2S iron-sulfur cluster-binding protein [Bdellovibrio sp. 22V]|uniref:2Fe-2S iron-sulfur cluster-binding protein n=1 Tax=Bdellovibrio TaxID=958 RepID=UPI0025427799|nr:2Fe-2S iron-sulfur cluster-binding protein [Bdellovibrio sp. 22V]WII72934.1 2Fe-2S iron-sulfur cluster-binding protein [Bdellovibrio sp. 22V]
MPKCTINGKEVEVKEGTSIIEAMQQSGDRIAHYCWHPGLSVAGVCRLCMVEIEGNPRVQIACNTMVTEGMKINNTSEKVRDAVKWGLDFHLINHPLDCPICDQAGECGLQDQYMEYGKYDPEMAEPKQKKHKVVDLGPTVVLDSERCILCSRCVRFTEEVSKTNELGIFNRGDRSEIGTHDGLELNNKYSLNTVDICPVGALTSKDFRFRQRVWYLKDAETVCNGCATGCSVKVYYNKEGFFRVKPVYNEKVNGHWMCDEGRDIYKFVNREHRLLKAQVRNASGWTEMTAGAAAKNANEVLKNASGDSLALVLTAQYTVEEFDAIVSTFVNEFKTKKVFFWINNKESFDNFDGLLLRGDKNPNTKGLLKVLEKHGITATWSDLSAGLANGSIKTIVVAGPENQAVFPDFAERVKELSKAQNLIWMQSGKNDALMSLTGNVWLIPMKSFVEKDGTFVNHAGLEQKFKKVTTVVSEALTLTEAALLLAGKNLAIPTTAQTFLPLNQREDQVALEARKKNEFVFRRGSL